MNVYRIEVSSRTQITGLLAIYWTTANDLETASGKVLKQARKDYSGEHPVVSKIERMLGAFVE